MFTIERQIAAKMQSLGVAASFICALSGVSATMFSAAMRNLKPLPNETAVRIVELLSDLAVLVDRVRPIPIALENPQVIRELLGELRDAKSRHVVATDRNPDCVLCGVFGSGGAAA